jgi:hypothetical protein
MTAATTSTSTASIAAVGNYSVNADRSCAAGSSCASRGASTTGSTISTATASDE